jgi:hypothetical protein
MPVWISKNSAETNALLGRIETWGTRRLFTSE